MNARRPVLEEHIENLLIDQATECGLDADQQQHLAALTDSLSQAEGQAYMETAALVQLGIFDIEQSQPDGAAMKMPAQLRQRILDTAKSGSTANVLAFDPPRSNATKAAARTLEFRDLGWALAAALAVALVLVRSDADVNAFETGTEAPLASATDVVTLPWQPQDNPAFAAVSGEVRWSDSRQAGLMTLRGLPANNPAEAQYQLWIIDPERSAQPVDGGVFDIPAGATETVVKIDAKLPVDAPTAFAITLEQPGGVVVSAGPLLVVASTST